MSPTWVRLTPTPSSTSRCFATGGRSTIVVIEHPSLTQILKIAFETVWAGGLTFEEAYDRLVTRRTQTAKERNVPCPDSRRLAPCD